MDMSWQWVWENGFPFQKPLWAEIKKNYKHIFLVLAQEHGQLSNTIN
jgi:hypothetical protein